MSVFSHICCSILFGVVLRCMVSLHPHSGEGKPPMHGDYEAQRHWMEITYHLPVEKWYINGTDNDLMYWGLDYPPLTAYHSWILGAISHRLNASWVELFMSRRMESYEHKVFMRRTVLAADLLVYIPAVIVFFTLPKLQQKNAKLNYLTAALLTLIYPGLILIDHGHFQYNCISLGLTLWAVIGLAQDWSLLGAIAFTLALNYKQMTLYYAIPFFTYLLGTCIHSSTYTKGFFRLCLLGAVVIGTFAICWLPFLVSIDQAMHVLHRLFPFARGLFEDKVANVWCSLSVVIKLKELFNQQTLIRITLVTTLLSSLPTSIHLLFKPAIRNFIFALINSSLAFFLYSYQVHEKSILLVALPVSLLLPTYPLLSVWFLMMSTFSMLPLFVKDGLVVAYLALMVIFLLISLIGIFYRQQTDDDVKQSSRASDDSTQQQTSAVFIVLFVVSCVGMALLTLSTLFVTPPSRLPDLHSVLVSVYSCGHFILFWIAFHYLQFSVDDSYNHRQSRTGVSSRTNQRKYKTN